MLPVSAWPPGSPGASLSPFGKPRQVCVGTNGFVIPKGAWIVQTTTNKVVMFFPPVVNANPARSFGTGLLPGSIPPASPRPKCGCSPSNEFAPHFRPFNETVEDFRAWQRRTGNTDPPLRQFAGRRPPNWYGWLFVDAPSSTLVPTGEAGLVVADGQNVVITGSGSATLTQAYSV
jgi:hypothetical protein